MALPHFRPDVAKGPGLFRCRDRWCGLLALGAALWLAVPCRGDHLDLALLDNAEGLIDHLKKKGYHRVGVLKFLVKLGEHSPTLNAGAMTTNMAERLENALVLRLLEKDDLQILHDCGQVIAAARQQLSHRHKEDRAKLFEFTYPVAWGGARVKPDAFLTGVVHLLPRDKGKPVTAQVHILSFDAWTPEKLEKVQTIRVAVDHTFLHDTARVRLSRRDGAFADFDDQGPAEQTKPDGSNSPPKQAIELRVIFGNDIQTPRPDPENPSLERLDPPAPNAATKFLIKNVLNERVGLLLKVNGLNTLDGTDKETGLSRLWVLEPNRQYEVDGMFIHKEGPEHRMTPFKAVSDEEFEPLATSLPDPGVIELAVFVSRPPAVPLANGKEMKVSLRGLAREVSPRERANLSLTKLRERLNGVSGSRASPRTGIVPNSHDEANRKLQHLDLPNPEMLGSPRLIRYSRGKDAPH